MASVKKIESPDWGFDESNRMRCECNTEWCFHLEDHIRNGNDAAALWASVFEFSQSGSLPIPVRPTKRLWVSIDFKREIGDLVTLFGRDGESIGLLAPGDGLIIARSMVTNAAISWLSAQTTVPPCRSSSHGMRAQQSLQIALKASNDPRSSTFEEYINQAVSLWRTERCNTCRLIESKADINVGIPDL
jgi:hypothetical protein